MYPVDFEQRLEEAGKRIRPDLNCHGATFYLLGLRNEEVNIDAYANRGTKRFSKNFEILLRSRISTDNISPEAEAFAIWHQGVDGDYSAYLHSGVIHPYDHTIIIHRLNLGCPLILEDVSHALDLNQYKDLADPPSYVELHFLRLKGDIKTK